MKIPLKSFYFVLHGETDWNRDGIAMGQMDIDLNQMGLDQAAAAGYVLVDMQIDSIYSSPLIRASKTAEIISDICELEVEIIEGLMERGLGKNEGKKREEIRNKIAEDEESLENFRNRVVAAISKILMSHNSYPLIVSHSGVFRVLNIILAGDRFLDCSNGKIFVFTPSPVDKSWDIEEL